MQFNEIERSKTDSLVTVLRTCLLKLPRDVLVVGCGTGLESGDIARAFGANTIGIDIGSALPFDHAAAAPAKLMIMDARQLRFADASFDLVYSFHALEHIQNPQLALAEMARVLRPAGTYLVGTPNKSRLIGYVGAPVPFKSKVRWNLNDFRMRLGGKWSNEAGAHAGFTEVQLMRMCANAFGGIPRSVSDIYYQVLYVHRTRMLRLLAATGLRTIVYPCVYVAGSKPTV